MKEKGFNNFLLTILISLFFVIQIKLFYYYYCFSGPCIVKENPKRVEIFDADNNLIATSMRTYSVYFVPYEFVDSVEEVATEISKILDVDIKKIKRRFFVKSKFVWITRHIDPKKANEISALGYSGIHITKDNIRLYPYADLFYHILGKVDDESHGIIGVEKHYNDYLSNPNNPPLKLSLKLNYQHILKDELIKGKKKFNAKNVGGVIVCAKTGKILAMFSKGKNYLNPHVRNFKNEFNLITQGKYELGSIMKVLSASMFLEKGLVNSHTELKIPPYYLIGKHKIRDYGKPHFDELTMTFRDAFIFSSNIAFVMLANENLSLSAQKEYYEKLGLFDQFHIDKISIKGASLPRRMRQCDISVFSYGYGVSVSIISYLRSFLRVVTGQSLDLHIEDNYIEGENVHDSILNKNTVSSINTFLNQSLQKSFDIHEFNDVKVGGKTGTAKKHNASGYQKSSNLTSYVFVYPIEDPKIVGIVFLDDPKMNNTPLYASSSSMIVGLQIIKRLLKNNSPQFKKNF